MKTKIVGQALVITADIKADALKVAPAPARTIKDEEDNEIFVIGFGKSASLTKAGAVFNAANAEDDVQMTIALPTMEAGARKDFVSNKYGDALVALNAAEVEVKASIKSYAKTIADVIGKVEVVD